MMTLADVNWNDKNDDENEVVSDVLWRGNLGACSSLPTAGGASPRSEENLFSDNYSHIFHCRIQLTWTVEETPRSQLHITHQWVHHSHVFSCQPAQHIWLTYIKVLIILLMGLLTHTHTGSLPHLLLEASGTRNLTTKEEPKLTLQRLWWDKWRDTHLKSQTLKFSSILLGVTDFVHRVPPIWGLSNNEQIKSPPWPPWALLARLAKRNWYFWDFLAVFFKWAT